MKKRFTAIILLNVLAGLLFSCGEGVRLLPFPSAEIAGNSRSQLKETKKIPYQRNILRFDSAQIKETTEAGRGDLQKFDSAGSVRVPAGIQRPAVPVHSLVDSSSKIPYRSLLLMGSKGSRPPPEFS